MASYRSPVPAWLALTAAGIAAALIAAMIVVRVRSGAERAVAAPVLGAPSHAAAVIAPAPATPIVDVAPPAIEGVKATAEVGAQGLELHVETALGLPAGTAPRSLVSIRARCHVGGDWFDGSGIILLDRLGAGTHVAISRVKIGGPHQLGTLPAACHLGYQQLGGAGRWRDRGWLAHVCWNGKGVVKAPCPPIERARRLVELRGLGVSSSLDRRATYIAGTPLALDVSIDAEARTSLQRWSLELVAECRMPDGTTQRDTGRIPTYGVHGARPFEQRTSLFRRSKLPTLPDACTLTLELADRSRLVREPIAVRCWRDGTLSLSRC